MNVHRLREKFDYDEVLGRFVHKQSGKGIRKGAVLKGKKMNTGYLSLWVDGKGFLYHRAVFLWHTDTYLMRWITRIETKPTQLSGTFVT